MGHSESSLERKVDSITVLPQEEKKISNKQSNPVPKPEKVDKYSLE